MESSEKINVVKPIKETIKEKQVKVETACNEFKVVGNFRNFAIKKYKSDKYTISEWRDLLKKDGILIK
jgi:hypothetical protein